MIQHISFKYNTLEECTQKANELVLMYKEIIDVDIVKGIDEWSILLKLDIENEVEIFKEIELRGLELVRKPINEWTPVNKNRTIFEFNVFDMESKKNIDVQVEINKKRNNIEVILKYCRKDIEIFLNKLELAVIRKKQEKWMIKICNATTTVWDRLDLEPKEVDLLQVTEINEKYIRMIENHIRNVLLQFGILLDRYSKDELEFRVRQVIESLKKNCLNEI